MTEEKPLLAVRRISKVFGNTRALDDVSLEIRAGEIHSLLGRNGAGKSTLVNIIAGIYPPSSGEVLFEGEDIASKGIFERQEMGIRLVPQNENSFPDLTVAENIFSGVLPTRRGMVDWKRIHREAAEELEAYGLHVDTHENVSALSSIDGRKLNIIRAMHSGAKLIILDEPTTALTNREREELFSFVRDLQKKGTAFIFISHYLGEVLDLSDEITVLRDGLMFPTDKDSELTQEYLAQLVAGSEVALTQRTGGPIADDAVIEARGVSTDILSDVDLDVRRGEVLGIVGFPGSGAREFCRTIFGLYPLKAGTIKVDGRTKAVKTPEDAIEAGISYISFDRHREGIQPTMDVAENIGISCHGSKLRRFAGFLALGQRRKLAEKYRDLLKIKCSGIEASMFSLSGGNQQKVLVSRSLATEPRILILDEPTVGIDIKSREEIISTVLELTRTGMSTIYLTNDYEELLRVADRLVFFDEGRVTKVLENTEISIEQLTEIRDHEKEAV